MASEKRYVIDRDGHLMSESEQKAATQLDDPVSIEGAPDTRGAHLASVVIDRNQKMIRSYERALQRYLAELPGVTDDEWRSQLETDISMTRHRISELQAEIRATTQN
jgi:hypothetical protein